MTLPSLLPLVGVTACLRSDESHRFHAVGVKYVASVVEGAGAAPVILPALGEKSDVPTLVARLDGLMLTGSPSNVEPHRYAGTPSRPGTLHDAARDATTLPLIRAALAAGLPLLALCRGIQELNVALGGTLHQLVHEVPGRRDHRSDKNQSMDERYGHAHPVHLVPGGLLHRLAGGAGEVSVNSLHAQSIDRLAPGLVVEATAPDGTIEAVRVAEARSFALGVQWHPEHPKALEWPLSRAMFAAFGDAARARAGLRASAAGILSDAAE